MQLKLQASGPVEDLFQKLDDTRFNLIVIKQQETAAANAVSFGSLVRTLVIPECSENEQALARAQLSGPLYYLLRPDGHVGLAGTHFEAGAVTRYFADRNITAGSVAPEHALADLPLSSA
jgi:hypothetical protein